LTASASFRASASAGLLRRSPVQPAKITDVLLSSLGILPIQRDEARVIVRQLRQEIAPPAGLDAVELAVVVEIPQPLIQDLRPFAPVFLLQRLIARDL
jgi:hypothetical protein